jgi:hypothetical protein
MNRDHYADIVDGTVASLLRYANAMGSKGLTDHETRCLMAALASLSEVSRTMRLFDQQTPRCDSCGRDCAPCEAGTCERIS